VLVCAALAACSGGGSTSSNPGQSCTLHPVIASDPLVFPADGSKGVLPTIGSVAVEYRAELVGMTVYVQPNGSTAPNGGRISGGAFAPSVGGMTLAASIPALLPGTLYFVTAETSQQSGSCPQAVSWSLGSFST
jgi:ABC-type phosphate transport system substrate-binding protein